MSAPERRPADLDGVSTLSRLLPADRNSALCCVCGNLKQVHRNYHGRLAGSVIGDLERPDLGHGIRMFRCSVCREWTKHAWLAPAMGPQPTLIEAVQAVASGRPAPPSKYGWPDMRERVQEYRRGTEVLRAIEARKHQGAELQDSYLHYVSKRILDGRIPGRSVCGIWDEDWGALRATRAREARGAERIVCPRCKRMYDRL